MPKLGEYVYPSLKLTRAIDIIRKICSAPYKGELSVSSLANELKMSDKGGAFIYLVAALKDYRLLEGRDTLRATDLSRRIVAGISEESARAKAEAFLSVDLFKKIKDRAGSQIPDQAQFTNLLCDLTKDDPLRVQERSGAIMEVYSDGMKYAEEAGEVAKATEIEGKPSMAVVPPSTEELKGPRGVRLWLPAKDGMPTREGITIAKGLLEFAEKIAGHVGEEERHDAERANESANQAKTK